MNVESTNPLAVMHPQVTPVSLGPLPASRLDGAAVSDPGQPRPAAALAAPATTQPVPHRDRHGGRSTLGFFLGVPDEVPRPLPNAGGGSSRSPDLLDQAFEFRAAFGAWPRTWMEFAHGIGHLGRAAAAEKLRIADATAAPHQKPADWKAWVSELRTISGA